MRKITALLLVITMIFTLVGCMGTFYQPVESTALEATTVMSFTIDGTRYDMKYELYRLFFLNYKSTVDGGDESVWVGEGREKYIARIEEIIVDRALDIYSVLALARRAGIDPYSADVGKRINEFINTSVEEFPSYEDYLEHLKAINLNYSTQELLFRYFAVLELLEAHYIGASSSEEMTDDFFEPGAFKYTEADVRDFYNSEEYCARILRMTFDDGAFGNTAERAEELRAEMASAKGEFAIASIIGNNSRTDGHEIERGYFLGKYNLNNNINGALVDATFALEVGEVSPVIRMHDGEKFVYHIIYRAAKSEDNFNANKTDITFVYLTDRLGEMLSDVAGDMRESTVRADFLATLDYSGISMDE